MTTRLTLAYSAPTDPATEAWEKARPKGDSNSPLSSATRALLETVQVARGGTDALIEALQEALVLKYEREDRYKLVDDLTELKREIAGLEKELDGAEERIEELEKERDALQEKLSQIARVLA
jgi:chromosome segregation ATPase